MLNINYMSFRNDTTIPHLPVSRYSVTIAFLYIHYSVINGLEFVYEKLNTKKN